jgi:hypothetical protein
MKGKFALFSRMYEDHHGTVYNHLSKMDYRIGFLVPLLNNNNIQLLAH